MNTSDQLRTMSLLKRNILLHEQTDVQNTQLIYLDFLVRCFLHDFFVVFSFLQYDI